MGTDRTSLRILYLFDAEDGHDSSSCCENCNVGTVARAFFSYFTQDFMMASSAFCFSSVLSQGVGLSSFAPNRRIHSKTRVGGVFVSKASQRCGRPRNINLRPNCLRRVTETAMLGFPLDAFQEECGVVGVWNHPNAAVVAYYALHALQHRGQEGAGMVVSNGSPQLAEHKGLGLVSEVFTDAVLSSSSLSGTAAIAHNRYSTAGAKSVRNVQPFVAGFRDGQVSIAHNGNLTNANLLREELEMRGSIFSTSSDTETILHLMATSVGSTSGVERKAADALSRVEGAYSVIIMTADTMVAVRDPHGFRPLVIGELDAREKGAKAIVFASESCALDIINAKLVREVEPGEMVVIRGENSMRSFYPFRSVRRKACVFEHIYFSKPSSIVFGRSVYMSRYRFGELLAMNSPVPNADIVVPIPESGIPAALGYAAACGVPYQQAVMRSHYVGRTFIAPSQVSRDIGVRLKLAPVRALIEGKVLVVVDDSIVRGTTSMKIVRMLREAGAKEVHLRIACPPIVGSCFYGVDTPNREELISYQMSDQAVCEYVGADSLSFLRLDSMHEFLGDEAPTFCDACFSSDYPVPPPLSAQLGMKTVISPA
jgi:amidophosphoribosyltransferase